MSVMPRAANSRRFVSWPPLWPEKRRISGELGPRVGQLVDGRQPDTHLVATSRERGDPLEDVPAPIPTRNPASRADRDVHEPAGLGQLFRDLESGLATAHDEYATLRQGRLGAVRVRMQLGQPGRQPGRDRRDLWLVEGARGDDAIRLDNALGRFEPEAAAIRNCEALHSAIAHDRCADHLGIAPDATDDLIPEHEPARIAALEGETRE
jgi:hypothetical protein